MDLPDTNGGADRASSRNTGVMKVRSLLQDIKASVYPVFLLAVAASGLFPLIIWGVAQLAFYRHTNGSP